MEIDTLLDRLSGDLAYTGADALAKGVGQRCDDQISLLVRKINLEGLKEAEVDRRHRLDAFRGEVSIGPIACHRVSVSLSNRAHWYLIGTSPPHQERESP